MQVGHHEFSGEKMSGYRESRRLMEEEKFEIDSEKDGVSQHLLTGREDPPDGATG